MRRGPRRLHRGPAEYLSEPGSIPDSRTTPLTQVPTITGSGSELTGFTTLYAGHHKHSLDHPSARADHVLIDPDLAATVPVPTAAASALDALAQAVESTWAVAATAESRDTAIRALENSCRRSTSQRGAGTSRIRGCAPN